MLQAAGEGEDVGDIARWSAWAGPVLSVPLWRPEAGRQAEAASARAEAQRARWQAVSLRAAEEIDRAWAERSRSEVMIGHAESIIEARTTADALQSHLTLIAAIGGP